MPLRARIDKHLPEPVRTPRAGMDRTHLVNVAYLPCLGCGILPSGTAHHLITGMQAIGERGAGFRAADRYAIPVDDKCHLATFNGSIHWLGSDELFFSPRGIDARAVADALWRARGDMDAMERIIFRARQTAIPGALDLRARIWRRAA